MHLTSIVGHKLGGGGGGGKGRGRATLSMVHMYDFRYSSCAATFPAIATYMYDNPLKTKNLP